MTVMRSVSALTVSLVWYVVFISVASALFNTESVKIKQFYKFMLTYRKPYKNTAEQVRSFDTFKINLEVIEKLNDDKQNEARYGGVITSSDLTPEESHRQVLRSNDSKEFEAMGMSRGGSVKPDRAREVPVSLNRRLPVPADSASSNSREFSWARGNPHYPEAVHQLGCGVCGAFAVVGAMEIMYSHVKKEAIHLSKQQLLDCDDRFNCDDEGVTLRPVFQYLKRNYLATEFMYPYRGTKGDQDCNKTAVKAGVARMLEYRRVRGEEAIKEALRDGPLPASVIGSYLQDYDVGIITNCPNTATDHHVTIVGYGVGYVDGEETPYYMIRNSWGGGYGIGGHAKIKRGTCNIESTAFSITIELRTRGRFSCFGGQC